MYLNRVELIGFTGSDAETKTTPNGRTVTSFSIATKASYKGWRQTRADRMAPHPGLGQTGRIRRRLQGGRAYLRRRRAPQPGIRKKWREDPHLRHRRKFDHQPPRRTALRRRSRRGRRLRRPLHRVANVRFAIGPVQVLPCTKRENFTRAGSVNVEPDVAKLTRASETNCEARRPRIMEAPSYR